MGVPVLSAEIADAWRARPLAAERHGKRVMGPILPDVDQDEAGAFVLGMDLGVLTASLRQLLDTTAPTVRQRMTVRRDVADLSVYVSVTDRTTRCMLEDMDIVAATGVGKA